MYAYAPRETWSSIHLLNFQIMEDITETRTVSRFWSQAGLDQMTIVIGHTRWNRQLVTFLYCLLHVRLTLQMSVWRLSGEDLPKHNAIAVRMMTREKTPCSHTINYTYTQCDYKIRQGNSTGSGRSGHGRLDVIYKA